MISTQSLHTCTPKDLRAYTVKELGQMAKKIGLPNWSTLRKDDLARAICRLAKTQYRKQLKAEAEMANATSKIKTKSKAATKSSRSRKKPKQPANPRIAAKLARDAKRQDEKRDLATETEDRETRDRIALLVRDAFWLHACWEVSRQSVARAKAALAEHWHNARPILRIYEVESGSTTSTAEVHHRDIEIHGAVSNWYIEVDDPPNSYRVDLGYLASNGKFFCIARSNVVSTPKPGSSDDIDQNWNSVAEDYERIYALSGGNDEGGEQLKELFEERLRRPMGSPVVTQFGVGAQGSLNRNREFEFEVDAEMIIFGSSRPNAHVSLSGEPVKLRPDGTFTIRLAMPDRRQVLPIVASSPDGVEERTVVLAVERNTKVMEPVTNDQHQ